MNVRLPSSALQPLSQKDSTVFTSGNSQAVRIPKEFQLSTKHVKIVRRGNDLVITPKYLTAAEILANLPPLDPNEKDDFDLAQIIRESNAKLPPERDLTHLFDDATPPIKPVRRKPKARA